VALLLASEGVFEAVRWLGAAYLVYLGVTFLWRAWRGGANPFIPDVAARQLAPMAAFRQGALSDLGNPKMAVFFSSLLPQFTDGFTGLAVHGLLFAGLTLAWLAGDAVVLSRPGNLIRRPSIWRAVEAVTGAALVALGLRLASGSH
jgi:threonine/homoserine/homoserine lactone efflux protein